MLSGNLQINVCFVAALALALQGNISGSSLDSDDPTVTNRAYDQEAEVRLRSETVASRFGDARYRNSQGHQSSSSTSIPQVRYRVNQVSYNPSVRVNVGDGSQFGLCASEGQTGLVYEVHRQDAGSDHWESLGLYGAGICDEDDGDEPATAQPPSAAQIREEAARLIVAPDGFNIQPPNLVSYVNADNIVYIEPEPQTIQANVLGFDVWIHAAPVNYEWDFGDGSNPFNTTDPGQPWPDHSFSHIYTHPGEYIITLTTRWEATYSFNSPDGPWLAMDGMLTTTNQSEPLTVRELRSRLVNN